MAMMTLTQRRPFLVSLCLFFFAPAAGSVLLRAQPPSKGLYLGARLGWCRLDTPTVRDRPGAGLLGFRRDTFCWAVASGYQWDSGKGVGLGLEAGYADNGAAAVTYASANEYEFGSTQIDFLGTVSLPLPGGIMAYGKGGVARAREEYRLSRFVSGTPDIDSHKTRALPVLAAGLGYRLTGRLRLGAEFRHLFGDASHAISKALQSTNPNPPPYQDVLSSVARVNSLSAGITCTLGKAR